MRKRKTPLTAIRILFCFAILTPWAASSLSAQPIDREMYAKVVGMNSKRNCPYYHNGWTVNKLRYTPGFLHFDITLKQWFVQGRDSVELRKFFADRIRYRLEPVEFNYLYQKLGDINGGFVYDITMDSTQTKLTLKYPPAEVRQMWADRSKPEYRDNTQWAARSRLSQYVHNSNANLPQQIDEFTRADTIVLKQDTLLYLFTFIEGESLKKEQIIASLSHIKKQGKSNLLLQTDFLETLVKAKINLTNRYLDTLGLLFAEIRLPYSELEELLKTSGKLKPATDAQIDDFIREQIVQRDSIYAATIEDDEMSMASIEYSNQILQYTYNISSELYGDGLVDENTEILRKSMAVNLNRITQNLIGESTVYNNGIITREHFYQYLKGVRLLYMEKGTRRTIDVFISSEEIQNSPMLDGVPMSKTSDHFYKQMIREEFLREMEEFIRDSLPMATDFGSFDSLRFAKSTLHFHYTVTPDITDPLIDSNTIKKNYRNQILLDNTEGFYESIIEMEASIAQHWHLPNDSILTLSFSTDEIRQAVEMSAEDVQQEMRELIHSEVTPNINKECPFAEDEYTILDSVGIQNGMLTYYYRILNSIPIENIDVEDMRWNLRSAMMMIDDEDNREMLDMLVKAGFGVCYHYSQFPQKQGKSKKAPIPTPIQICFTLDELSGFLEE